MADLSHLSDEELQAIAGGKSSSGPDLSHLSDDQLSAIAGGGAQSAQPAAISKFQSLLGGAQKGIPFNAQVAGLSGLAGAKMGGDPRPMGDIYREARDEFNQEKADQQKANPRSFMAGQLGGTALTAATLGAAGKASGLVGAAPQALEAAQAGEAGAGASTLANLAQTAKNGALLTGAQGGLMGLSEGNADLTKGEVGKAAGQTALGAGTGAALGALAPALPGPVTGAGLGGVAGGLITGNSQGVLKGAAAGGLAGLIPGLIGNAAEAGFGPAKTFMVNAEGTPTITAAQRQAVINDAGDAIASKAGNVVEGAKNDVAGAVGDQVSAVKNLKATLYGEYQKSGDYINKALSDPVIQDKSTSAAHDTLSGLRTAIGQDPRLSSDPKTANLMDSIKNFIDENAVEQGTGPNGESTLNLSPSDYSRFKAMLDDQYYSADKGSKLQATIAGLRSNAQQQAASDIFGNGTPERQAWDQANQTYSGVKSMFANQGIDRTGIRPGMSEDALQGVADQNPGSKLVGLAKNINKAPFDATHSENLSGLSNDLSKIDPTGETENTFVSSAQKAATDKANSEQTMAEFSKFLNSGGDTSNLDQATMDKFKAALNDLDPKELQNFAEDNKDGLEAAQVALTRNKQKYSYRSAVIGGLGGSMIPGVGHGVGAAIGGIAGNIAPAANDLAAVTGTLTSMIGKPIVAGVNAIASMPASRFSSLADTMEQKGMSNTADALRAASEETNSSGQRAAAAFSLLQNPLIRKQLGNVSGKNGNENQ